MLSANIVTHFRNASFVCSVQQFGTLVDGCHGRLVGFLAVTAPQIEGHPPKEAPRSLANYPAGTKDPFVGRESKDSESLYGRFTGQLPGDCGNRERSS
jgi:hypothetical protein